MGNAYLRSNAEKFIPLIGFLLICMSAFWLIAGGLGIVGLALIASVGYGTFMFFRQRIPPGKRWFIFLITSIIVLVLILSFLGIGLINPIIGFAGIVSGLFNLEIIRPTILLVVGLFLIFYGKVMFKIMGLFVVFIGFTGAAGDVASIFSKLGATNSNYFLFAIALMVGLILLFKVHGSFPKILGVFLPILTFPPVAEQVNVGIGTLFSTYDVVPGYLTISALLIGLLAILSAIYMMKEARYSGGTTGGMFLAVLLIMFSFSQLVSLFLDPIIGILQGPLNLIGSFEPSYNSIFVFFVGIVCLLYQPVSWGLGKVPYEVKRNLWGQAREELRTRVFRQQPATRPDPSFQDPNTRNF